MNKHAYTFGFIAARNGKPYCNTCTLPFEDEIHGGEDMADIDAVDNHMGRTTEGTYPVKRHMFVGPTQQGSCHNCGSLRIHDNHRGFDYDATPGLHIRPDACIDGLCTCEKPVSALSTDNPSTTIPDREFCNVAEHDVKPLEPERRVSETIAEEASRIVYGDREQTYDDPYSNFQRIAHMWTGTLLKKLAPGTQITARDVAVCMVQVKVAREAHKPQRDNRVDIIGYALCLDRIVQAEDE